MKIAIQPIDWKARADKAEAELAAEKGKRASQLNDDFVNELNQLKAERDGLAEICVESCGTEIMNDAMAIAAAQGFRSTF